MQEDIRRKVYVEVTSKTDVEGTITPISIVWEDGTNYTVDRILDVRRAASTRAGGIGIRYNIIMDRHETYLFYEDIEPCRWFVEGR